MLKKIRPRKSIILFRFHTAFVDPDDDVANIGSPYRTLSLSREELDNPHKEKTWKVFGPTFRVELKLKIVEGPS